MGDRYPHHRPRYHLSLPHGYLNDPNGPIEVHGLIRLFFQSRPFADLRVPVQWGTATTTDLVHWTLHRPAMSPTPGGLDSDGCWSGNTVLDGGRVRAFYSGHIADRPLEHILTAVSDDRGASFGPPELLLEEPDPSAGVVMLRDPFVWSGGAGLQMVIGCGLADGSPAIRHYRSADRRTWRYVGDIAALPRTVQDGVDTGEGWECPQIIGVDGREVALVCAWSFAGGPGSVLAFPLGGTPRPQVFDDGNSFYAPSVMRDGAHGPVPFGWLREGRDDAWWQEEGWAGVIALPRRVWLADSSTSGPRLCSEPHPALAALRLGAPLQADGAQVGAQVEVVLPAVSGRLRVRFGVDEWVDIDVDLEAGTVEVDRSRASADRRAHRDGSVMTDAFDGGSGRAAVRVLLDGSTLEVFTSGGRSLSTRVYPLAPPPWRVEAPSGAQVWRLDRAITPSASKFDGGHSG